MRGFGRIEFGFNMVNNNPVFITGGDPGFSVGQGGQVLGTRLGYVGLDTPLGTLQATQVNAGLPTVGEGAEVGLAWHAHHARVLARGT